MRIPSSTIGVSMFAALLVATPVGAAPITWSDSGAITFIGSAAFPGLTIGTPWSLQVTFDPAGGHTTPYPHFSTCNVYQSGPTIFTLGAFTYTQPGGQIWTNSNLPGEGCDDPSGGLYFAQIQFEWVPGWTQEPGAWNLNSGFVLLAGYRDALHQDGTLPTVPSLTDFSSGLNFYAGDFRSPTFQDRTFAPTAVPEPGTLAMLSVGLAYGARRFRQRAQGR